MDDRAILPMAFCTWLDCHAGRRSGKDIHCILPHAHHVTKALEDLPVELCW